jgi:secreted trypsin-like serine protease
MNFRKPSRAPLVLVVVLVVVAASALANRPTGGRFEVGHPVRGMVALVEASAPQHDIFNGQFCGGVLVGATRVLTAAHCVTGRDPATIDAVVGADNLCRDRPIDGTRIAVTAISVDPSFHAATGQFDLADLTLERAVPAEWARAIADFIPMNEPALALGWGRALPNGVSACRLMRTALAVLNQTECAARLGSDGPSFDEPSMLCAVPRGAQGENTCAGDSGGPLFLGNDPATGLLVGIVSWGRGCDADWPGVYARVSGAGQRLSHQPRY